MRWPAPWLVVGWAGACAPAAPPVPPRPLTPADVGLPATPAPDPRAPLVVRPVAGPPPFYQRVTCPPGRGGCVWSREITAERVRTTLSCPDGASLFGGARLRRLDHGVLTVDGDLAYAHVRRPLVQRTARIEACLAPATERTAFRIAGVIVGRRASALTIAGLDAAARACVRDAVAGLAFVAGAPTRFAFDLVYVVEDPAIHAARPLRCP